MNKLEKIALLTLMTLFGDVLQPTPEYFIDSQIQIRLLHLMLLQHIDWKFTINRL